MKTNKKGKIIQNIIIAINSYNIELIKRSLISILINIISIIIDLRNIKK